MESGEKARQKIVQVTIRLGDAYLCPGDEHGAHITNDSRMCSCGNSNIVPLAKILDREITVNNIIEILQEHCPGIDKEQLGQIYRS